MKIKKGLSLLVVFVMLFSMITAGFADPQEDVNIEKYLEFARQKHSNKDIELEKLGEEEDKTEEPKYEPEEEVRLIVEVEGRPIRNLNSTNVENQINELEDLQADVQNEILDVGVDADFRHQYFHGLNGFSIETQYKNLDNVKGLRGVKDVYVAQKYTLDMESSKEIITKDMKWEELDYKGEGMLVAVLDTGIDWEHQDFQEEPTNPKYTEESIEEKLWETEAPDIYYNDKVITGYDWADNDSDVIPDVANKPEASPHGVHVAGTVAANGEIVGVAPEAQLLAEKVFSDDRASAYTDDIVAGIIHAINMDADVINMSLGSPAGFQQPDTPYEEALELAVDNGIMVAVSAGNSAHSTNSFDNPFSSNPDIGVVGSPSVYGDTLSVASYENTTQTGPTIKFGDDNSVLYTPTDIDPVESLPNAEGYEYVYCGLGGDASDFEDKDLEGKIALIMRGGFSFTDKLSNAKDAGAAGAIIFNSESNGNASFGMLEEVDIPAISIGYDDGIKMKEATNKTVKFDGTIKSVANANKHEMSDFTSWGIAPNLEFKPEISAPGGDIWSTVNYDGYESMSGTSMAAPHVAGASAVLLEALDSRGYEKGRERIELAKKLLMNTASPIVDTNSEGETYYSPRRQGAGIMQLDEAIEAPAYIEFEDDKAAISLKEIDNIDNSETFDLTLTSLSDETVANAVYYNVYASDVLTDKTFTVEDEGEYLSVETTPVENAGMTLSGEEIDSTVGKSVYLEKGESKDLTFTLDIDPDKLDSESFVEGFIELRPTAENPDLPVLSIPYVGFYGEWDKPNNIDPAYWEEDSYTGYTGMYNFADVGMAESLEALGWSLDSLTDAGHITPLGYDSEGNVDKDYIAFSPDGDGYLDAVSTAFTLLRNAKDLDIYVEDAKENNIKDIFSYEYYRKNVMDSADYVNYSSADFSWLGLDKDGKPVEDGQYNIVIESTIDYPGAKAQTYKMPVKVDTVAPELSDLTVGKVASGYNIDWETVEANEVLYYDIFVDGEYVDYTTDTNYILESDVEPQSVVVIATDFAQNMGYIYSGDPNIVSSEAFDTVTIDGTNVSANRPVEITASTIRPVDWTVEIVDPAGNVVGDPLTDTNTAEFEATWSPDEHAASGTYKAVFKVEDDKEKTAEFTKEFTVYNYESKIQSLELIDTKGEVIESASNGMTVNVKSTLENLGPNALSSMLIIKVTDEDDKLVHMGTLSTSELDTNMNQELTTGFTILEIGAADTYNVEAYVWDSFNSMNPMSSVESIDITVE